MEVDSTTSMENDQDPVTTSSLSPSSTPPTTSSSPLSSPMEKDVLQQQQIVGPRCAPSYTDVHAIIEKPDDGPGPRCGHTLTSVPAVGEEGSPGYIGPRLILFGGATALEGNSAATGTPSSAGSAGISMLRTLFLSFCGCRCNY